MQKILISLVSLGSLKYPVDMAYLEKWNSRLLTIRHGASIDHLPNAEGSNWEYTKEQLGALIQEDNNADFTLALINAPIENNYYMRRLSNKVGVLSLYEMAEIVRFSDFTIESFILRNIYELAVLYTANSGLIPADVYSWAHDDVRGCLFDMNANKSDIVFSLNKPKLCDGCRGRLQSKQINSGFLPEIDRELSRIKKDLYFRIGDLIKEHPLYALAGTAMSAIIINLIASMIFEKIK